MNGRVADVLTVRESASQYYGSSMRGQWEDTRDIRGLEASPVSDLYFSRQNSDALQEGIRWRVNVESNGKYVIARQSETDLKIIMRSIFLQESKDSMSSALDQVRELNAKVLAFCVPRIVNEVAIYKKYLDDISKLPVPLDRGEIATSKGSRELTMGPRY